MTKTALKYTLSEHCSGALRFGSGATGALLDYDFPVGFECQSLTSDPVRNQVDTFRLPYEKIYGVVIVPARAGLPLLPAYLLPAHTWYPTFESPPRPITPTSVEAAPPSQPTTLASPEPQLAEVAGRIRDLTGLPVADVAAMVGIGRRQFYNLLGGGSASLETELRVRHLAALLDRLTGVVGEEPEAVRSALLTPVGAPARSVFEVALAGEDAKFEEALDALLDRIERRGLRQVPRAVPRQGIPSTQQRDGGREALGALPPLDFDLEDAGEH